MITTVVALPPAGMFPLPMILTPFTVLNSTSVCGVSLVPSWTKYILLPLPWISVGIAAERLLMVLLIAVSAASRLLVSASNWLVNSPVMALKVVLTLSILLSAAVIWPCKSAVVALNSVLLT